LLISHFCTQTAQHVKIAGDEVANSPSGLIWLTEEQEQKTIFPSTPASGLFRRFCAGLVSGAQTDLVVNFRCIGWQVCSEIRFQQSRSGIYQYFFPVPRGVF
jgi:hypothetical protein